MATEILVKGMVCNRCISILRSKLEAMGFPAGDIRLGKISIAGTLHENDFKKLESTINSLGFRIHANRAERIAREIETIIAEALERHNGFGPKQKLSELLSEKLHVNYDSLSSLFSSYKGMTIEKYVLLKRLEKAKRLISNSGLSLTEIAEITGYSSVYHLSRQFKELTGVPPSHFREFTSTQKILQEAI